MMKTQQTPSSSQTHKPQCQHKIWRQHYRQAQSFAHTGRWDQATQQYHQAVDIAEQLLDQNSDAINNSNLYLRTMVEFIYALRMADIPCDFEALVAIAEFRLTQKSQPSHPKLSPVPLKDVAFSSKQNIRHWISVLFAMDERKKNTLH